MKWKLTSILTGALLATSNVLAITTSAKVAMLASLQEEPVMANTIIILGIIAIIIYLRRNS